MPQQALAAAQSLPRPVRRSSDHRLRSAIRKSGNTRLFHRLDIPESTRRSWASRPLPKVVTFDAEEQDFVDLHVRVAKIEATNAKLRAVIRLLLALVSVLGGRLWNQRAKKAADKARLLAAIDRSEDVLGRPEALRVLGLTDARVREWKRRAVVCQLEDAPSCPKSSPGQLTTKERRTIRELVTNVAYRHFSITSLVLFAARQGAVVASRSTWYREMKRQGLRRPRKRIHPKRPKHGVRADSPNQLWHIDASQVRLLNGTKAWLHAVIDNASRKVLAWTVAPSCEAAATLEVLREAVKFLPKNTDPVSVITDDGRENVAVHDESFKGILERITAQVDVSFSNSMIENLWHQAKHRFLYLHELDTVEPLTRLFRKYVEDHNTLIPRAALGGRTPDEVYFGNAVDVPEKLAEARARARVDRVAFNRSQRPCGGCDGPRQPTPRKECVDGR